MSIEVGAIQSQDKLEQVSQKVLLLDQIYRQQVVSAMVNSNFRLVIGLMTNHMCLLKNSFLEGRRFSAPVMGGKFLAANGQIARLTRP